MSEVKAEVKASRYKIGHAVSYRDFCMNLEELLADDSWLRIEVHKIWLDKSLVNLDEVHHLIITDDEKNVVFSRPIQAFDGRLGEKFSFIILTTKFILRRGFSLVNEKNEEVYNRSVYFDGRMECEFENIQVPIKEKNES